MPGLNEYLTDTAVTTEAMPSWFTGAQEKLIEKAGQAVSPAIGATTAQKAIDVFGAQGPFGSAQSTLETIGSGAANPWITKTDAMGQRTTTPNVATPLGGLFSAQQQYLNQILPDISAAETAKSIAGGGFGSRMNLSAVERAKAAAAADLFQKQMSAALQGQQTGVQAATGLGTLGSQLAKARMKRARLSKPIHTQTWLTCLIYTEGLGHTPERQPNKLKILACLVRLVRWVNCSPVLLVELEMSLAV